MTNKQNVIWRTYPEYPFVEANQFGEIKTVDYYTTYKNGSKHIVKGHVLKQHADKGGYMHVSFCVNGKQVSRLVHRIVAGCFLPNPENLPEVNHKDCNPQNNVVSNLEWCTPQQNTAYREKYGISAKEATKALKKHLYAVNLETEEVLFFESQGEASRQLGVNRSNIYAVLKGFYKYAGKYWFTENKSEITEEKIQKIKDSISHDVFAVDLKTSKVLYFKLQKEAAQQLGVGTGSISGVLRGLYPQAKGYWFTKDKSEITEEKIQKIKDSISHDVLAINSETFEVSRFKSQSEAARQLGVDLRRVNDVLKGRLKKVNSDWFCYADSEAVEKVRVRFNDKVASKVEALTTKK